MSRGLTMPVLEIIDTDALNAYASGLREGDYRIAVTRGLVDTLQPAELEAVLAHELTHIRNKDAQLMVFAVIFAGVFAFFGDLLIRGWDFPYGWSPHGRGGGRSGAGDMSTDGGSWDTEGSSSSSSNRDRNGGGGAIVAIVVAVLIILITWGISTLIRFALSRSREFLADAGSAELTKNPEAMISALKKIENHASLPVVSRMEAFFIENPVQERVTGLLATHPSIADRIAALQRFAGAKK